MKYDEIVDASELVKRRPFSSPQDRSGFHEAVRLFDNSFYPERIEISETVGRLVAKVNASIPDEERQRTIVSLIVDHSGSMCGLKMLSALIAIESVTDALNNMQIDFEVLGFTATGWRGGLARWAGAVGWRGGLARWAGAAGMDIRRAPCKSWPFMRASPHNIQERSAVWGSLEDTLYAATRHFV